jgi:hypothetical protein
MRCILLLLLLAFFILGKGAEAVAGIEQPTAEAEGAYTPNNTNYYLLGKRNDPLPAEKILPTLPKHHQTFIKNYVNTRWFHDDVMLKDLIHPVSRACENASNGDYYDYIRYFYLNEEIPQQYRVQIMQVKPNKQEALAKRAGLPITPTHVLFIEYGQSANEKEVLQRFLREETKPSPVLYEVVKCPTAQILQQFRQQLKDAEKHTP